MTTVGLCTILTCCSFIGTFNLNGRTEGIDEDLSPWLCPPELRGIQPEIIAIGFQEIVELNPQQIMNSDPTRKQAWERAIKRTLDKHYKLEGDDKYVLLRSGQLVGAALCIFVKASVLPHIKNVEGSVKKTGLSGMAGNKGAVAIRLDYANTPICFVTAHLAAGFANYDERNRDYATIDQGLWFQRNRGIRDHGKPFCNEHKIIAQLTENRIRHLVWRLQLSNWAGSRNDQEPCQEEKLGIAICQRSTESADDRWSCLSVLFRGPHQLLADI